MKNHADLTRSWYQLRPFEQKLYRTLRVKTWKSKLPTYYPDLCDPSLHTLPEIAGAMCQAELVHEVIIPLSLLPILRILTKKKTNESLFPHKKKT